MTEEIINDIDKLDGMTKIKGKCGYEIIGGCSDLRRLKQENEKLKEENVKLLFGKGALIKLCDNLTKIIDEKKEKESKLWQALEEIREILLEHSCADSHTTKYITNKINEVLGNESK